LTEELHEVDLWEVLWSCKTRKGLAQIWRESKINFDALEKLCKGNVADRMRLRALVAQAMALGQLRGMQYGTQIGVRSGGTIAESMVKYPSVTRLLLKGFEEYIPPYRNGTPEEPKENSHEKASTLEICRALDVVNEPLPWPDLRKENRLWANWTKNPTVKMAITHARKDALQSAIDEKFIALLREVGDEGTIFGRFQVKQRGVAKRRT
jgi:hypothetical protein